MPKPIPILDLAPQREALWPELQAAVERVMRSGAFILGEEVAAFEAEAAAFLGVKHAIGLNSGTDALVIALRALNIGAGDEVITTPFSFFATAESISMVGAKPIFVDVDEHSFNINPHLIEQAITSKTKAIMPVHLFGLPANMTEILRIAKQHKLKVIEDCAQSFGAIYQGTCTNCSCTQDDKARVANQPTGSLGDVAAFSFYPTKNLGAYGDAGLLTTNSDSIAEQVKKLRNHGSLQRYHNEMLGYNSRLDGMQAAILRVKLPHLNRWNQQRYQVASRYTERLKDSPDITTPKMHPSHVFHQYTLRIHNGKRDYIQEKLQEQGIASIIYYPFSQDQLPVYQGQYGNYKHSHQLAKEVLSLPIWPEISQEQQARVTKVINDAVRN